MDWYRIRNRQVASNTASVMRDRERGRSDCTPNQSMFSGSSCIGSMTIEVALVSSCCSHNKKMLVWLLLLLLEELALVAAVLLAVVVDDVRVRSDSY